MANIQTDLTPREQQQQNYNKARSNLLLMIVLTAVNIVLLIAGSDSMLLFSASIPYFAVAFPVILEMPELMMAGVIVAVISLLLYLLCWIFSKKRSGWMVVALVLFILDTVAMAFFYILAEEVGGLLDVIFHVWVLVYLIQGIISGAKLKKLPPEEETVPEEPAEGETAAPRQSSPIRRADEEVKHRVLLEVTQGTYRICYRRVKRVNELVINGWVYDEYEALMETGHTLTAYLDGHCIQAVFDDRTSQSRIFFDENEVARKMRLY